MHQLSQKYVMVNILVTKCRDSIITMYSITYMVVLKNVMNVFGTWFSGWILEFYLPPESARFSTLKIDGQACNTFRARRARTATCGAKQLPVDADDEKLGRVKKRG